MDSRSPTCCQSRPWTLEIADRLRPSVGSSKSVPATEAVVPWHVHGRDGRLPHAGIDAEGTTQVVYLEGELRSRKRPHVREPWARPDYDVHPNLIR